MFAFDEPFELLLFLLHEVHDPFEVGVQVQLNFLLVLFSILDFLPNGLFLLFEVAKHMIDVRLQLVAYLAVADGLHRHILIELWLRLAVRGVLLQLLNREPLRRQIDGTLFAVV